MRRWSLCLCALSLACALDGSIGRAETTGASSGGTGTGDASDDTTAADSTQTGGMSGGGSGEGGGSDGTTTHDGSTGHVPDACIPEQTDHACSQCRKHNCCAPLQACTDYDPCPCMWHCMLETDAQEAECALHCGYDGHTLSDLSDCAIDHCSDVCSDPHPPGPMD